MATQSLYRRFRPRKFSELYGQDHVVKALRNAVINNREGQAYLFSGPRGTGKTSTARILAKVLNCAAPVDGEPCCACDSCNAVESGASFDVLELDAASNNGVQEIRDLIDSAALATPGRHRVFILDEVHMLSRGAEAALLKTLEEPPEQVVFVLATTDPQKVSETIRSRVQHFQFHLIPLDELEKYVRWVIAQAQLDVSDTAIEQVLQLGGGSARDTLSALEIVVAGGGDLDTPASIDEIFEALIAKDQAQALAAVAFAIQQGRDARSFTEDIVRSMRDAFLSLMAPELVQLPTQRTEVIAAMARDLGAQTTVRVMEVLGTTLIEMRHAPDPRLLLEVAMVKLASPAFDDSFDNLTVRIQQLEEAVKTLKEKGVGASLPPAPRDPTTGRAQVGGRARTGPATARQASSPPATGAGEPSATAASHSDSAVSKDNKAVPKDNKAVPKDDSAVPTGGVAEPSAAPASKGDPAQLWPQVVDALTGFPKALFKPASVVSVDGDTVTISVPSNTPMPKVQESASKLQATIQKVCGVKYTLVFTQDPTASRGIERPRVINNVLDDEPIETMDPADIENSVEVPPMNDVDELYKAFPGGSVQDS
jgi:DNA polymerase-3 subunit gamma/tau